MAIPIQPNTTCDVYRSGTAPPAAPAVAGVACYLQPDWPGGQEHGDRGAQLAWTHVMLVDAGVDLRDAYTGAMTRVNQDTVYVPDKNGTAFTVVFIERVHRNQATDHKRIYLDRQTPGWPTSEL
jgi:hypothetical protein